MKVLLGMSRRALSVCFTREIGNVIPTFSVLSAVVVPFILVLYIVLARAIRILLARAPPSSGALRYQHCIR